MPHQRPFVIGSPPSRGPTYSRRSCLYEAVVAGCAFLLDWIGLDWILRNQVFDQIPQIAVVDSIGNIFRSYI